MKKEIIVHQIEFFNHRNWEVTLTKTPDMNYILIQEQSYKDIYNVKNYYTQLTEKALNDISDAGWLHLKDLNEHVNLKIYLIATEGSFQVLWDSEELNYPEYHRNGRTTGTLKLRNCRLTPAPEEDLGLLKIFIF